MKSTPIGAESSNKVLDKGPYPQLVTDAGVFNIPHYMVPAFSDTGNGMKVIPPNASAS